MKLRYVWQDWVTFTISVVVGLSAIAFWVNGERIAAIAFGFMAIYNGVTPALSRSTWNNAYVLGHTAAITRLVETFAEHEIIGQSTLQRWAMHELHDTAEQYKRASE